MLPVSCFRPLRDDEVLPVRTHRIVLEGQDELPEPVGNKSKKKHKKEKEKSREKKKDKKVRYITC